MFRALSMCYFKCRHIQKMFGHKHPGLTFTYQWALAQMWSLAKGPGFSSLCTHKPPLCCISAVLRLELLELLLQLCLKQNQVQHSALIWPSVLSLLKILMNFMACSMCISQSNIRASIPPFNILAHTSHIYFLRDSESVQNNFPL